MDSNLKLKADSKGHTNLLKTKGLGLLIVAFLLIKVLLALFLPEKQFSLASDLTSGNILAAVNQQRSLRNLGTLNTNSKLSGAAQSKSDDMQARHYFSHVDPDGHYIWDKIVAAGYTPYLQLGENLAIEFYDTDSLIAAWMNSPTHRANILQADFRDQGMGLNLGDTANNQYYSAVTNTFGTLALQTHPKPSPTPTPVPVSQPVVKSPPQKTPLLITQAAPKAAPSPTSINKAPVQTRGSQSATNPLGNFALPSGKTQAEATGTQNQLAVNTTSAPLVGNSRTSLLTGYEANRYLTLIFGLGLFLFLLRDIKNAVEKKLGVLDKKINNLAMLLISLFVVTFLYWL